MRKGGQLKFLTQENIADIYFGALEILQQTGVKVPVDEVVRELKAAGCLVNGSNVKMPSSLVEQMLRKAPSRFALHGRDPANQVGIEGRRVYFQPMIGRLNILDLETHQKRRTTIEDVAGLVKIADALPCYHILHSGAIMPHIEGIPDQVAHLYGYLVSAQNTSKVIKGTCRGKDKAIDCIEMAAAIAGGEDALRARPNIHTTYNVISPLEHGREMLEGMTEFVKYGLPVDITSEPQTGATSPVTIAGTLVQQTAELFSGIVIAQVLSPGTPVFMGNCGAAMDMRYGTISLGGIEAGLLNAAHAQIAQYCRIPSRGTGPNTESKLLDFQAGYEKMMTAMLPAFAGINMIFYPGTLEHAETISMASLILDHEICSTLLHAMKGVSVTEDTMARDVIHRVGSGGFFLKERHTIQYLEQEHYLPKLADRRKRVDWESSGGKDLSKIAEEEATRILAEHQPMPLEDKTKDELLRIAKQIEEREFDAEGHVRLTELF